MSRLERRMLSIIDRLARLRREREVVAAELEYHRHIHDDAVRDATLMDTGFEKMEAGSTGGDVKRFTRRLDEIDAKVAELEARRVQLSEKLF